MGPHEAESWRGACTKSVEPSRGPLSARRRPLSSHLQMPWEEQVPWDTNCIPQEMKVRGFKYYYYDCIASEWKTKKSRETSAVLLLNPQLAPLALRQQFSKCGPQTSRRSLFGTCQKGRFLGFSGFWILHSSVWGGGQLLVLLPALGDLNALILLCVYM